MELLGEKSRCSISDRMPVHHGDRHYFHACVGDKTLVCPTDRFDPEISFVNWDLQLSSEVEHNIARDTVQQAACECRGTESASFNEEEIADGAFRQVRFPIE